MSLFRLLRTFVRPTFYAARALWMSGKRFACPLCGRSFRTFLPKGDPVRPHAMCPGCFSLERHRLLWLFLQGKAGDASLLAPGARWLHMAPEPALAAKLRALPAGEYRSADRELGRADEVFDLTAIPHLDHRFDRILCCHVLEHVPEDRQALRELHRVLAPGGLLLVQVPLGTGPTREDALVTAPEMRRRLFGQEDHVRLYGLDLADRMREVGFKVRVARPWDALAPDVRTRYRLSPDGEEGEPVFVAEK